MKRMIACRECAERVLTSYPGEWYKRVHGTAKKDMFCDWCTSDLKKISIGDECAAESFGAGGVGIPYYEWEKDYINIV